MDQHHWSYDNSGYPPPYNDGAHFNNGGGFSNDGHYNHHHNNNNRRFQNHHHDEPTDSFRYTNGPAFSGRKRQYSQEIEGGGCVKLYVKNCPTEVTEEDIRSLFGEYGNIAEVILFKQIKNLQQQGKTDCCFVKYTNIEDAEQAIRALHGQYTFPGKPRPIEVRYASKKQERPGPGVIGGFKIQEKKVFVGFLNKHATKPEIADIFLPYGYVEDIFILVDDQKRSRGMGFIEFSDKAMAVAAINGLNGKYVMEGCDQPLVVRFAEPKKPKFGDSRFTPYNGDPAIQPSLPNSSYMSSHNGNEHPSVSSSSSAPTHTDTEDFPECDWSEHICPDGNTYYYNCVTCESLWKKPEEYSFYEQYLENYNQHSPWQHTY